MNSSSPPTSPLEEMHMNSLDSRHLRLGDTFAYCFTRPGRYATRLACAASRSYRSMMRSSR